VLGAAGTALRLAALTIAETEITDWVTGGAVTVRVTGIASGLLPAPVAVAMIVPR
jgi:hypothetical protein